MGVLHTSLYLLPPFISFIVIMKFATAVFAAFAGLVAAHDYNDDVVNLDLASFEAQVPEGKWLVKMYAPWCGHCKRLKPTWDDLASETKGDFNIGVVDCTIEKELCGKHGVRGYPTILYFGEGESETGTKYQGQRDIGAFKSFLES